jgi:hypothetical protein
VTEAAIDSSAGHANLAEALVAAQSDMPAVEPDAVNPHYGSKFTSLGKLLSVATPVLNKHGIALSQMPSQDEQGRPALTTRLTFKGNESDESTMPLLMTKSDPQSLGSALTYAKRYALAAVLAIADQEDDDGNAATSNGNAPAFPLATEAERATLATSLQDILPKAEAEATWGEIKQAFGGELYGPAAQAVVAVIRAKKALEE